MTIKLIFILVLFLNTANTIKANKKSNQNKKFIEK